MHLWLLARLGLSLALLGTGEPRTFWLSASAGDTGGYRRSLEIAAESLGARGTVESLVLPELPAPPCVRVLRMVDALGPRDLGVAVAMHYETVTGVLHLWLADLETGATHAAAVKVRTVAGETLSEAHDAAIHASFQSALDRLERERDARHRGLLALPEDADLPADPDLESPHLGFDTSYATGRVVVSRVYEGSSARAAGLEVGDRLLRLGEADASVPALFGRARAPLKTDETVSLTVERGDRTQTLSIVLRPEREVLAVHSHSILSRTVTELLPAAELARLFGVEIPKDAESPAFPRTAFLVCDPRRADSLEELPAFEWLSMHAAELSVCVLVAGGEEERAQCASWMPRLRCVAIGARTLDALRIAALPERLLVDETGRITALPANELELLALAAAVPAAPADRESAAAVREPRPGK